MYTFYQNLTIFWNIAVIYYPSITFWCWWNLHFYCKLMIFWNIAVVYYPLITFWCWWNVQFLPQINYFLSHYCYILPYIHFLVLMKYTLFTAITFFRNIADMYYPALTFWCWWNVNFLLQFTEFWKHCWSKLPYIHFFMHIKQTFKCLWAWKQSQN